VLAVFLRFSKNILILFSVKNRKGHFDLNSEDHIVFEVLSFMEVGLLSTRKERKTEVSKRMILKHQKSLLKKRFRLLFFVVVVVFNQLHLDIESDLDSPGSSCFLKSVIYVF